MNGFGNQSILFLINSNHKSANIFTSNLHFELIASTRISVQPLGKTGWIFHNYNKTKENISFIKQNLSEEKLLNGFTGEVINSDNDTLNLSLQPRSRMWVKIGNDR